MANPTASANSIRGNGDPSPWCIDLSKVTKVYRGKIRALEGIAMRVAPGEVFGLLGPNGAGKSTLVKIMMTVVHPTHAEGTILGRPVCHKGALREVGYLPEHHRFPGYLNGAQVLDYYAALAGVPRRDRRRRAAALLDRVGMARWAKTPVSRYSKGMMQRVGLAQALMNDPRLVVLDEPTDGVDPVGRKEIRDLLSEIRAEGRTVFLNSHLLSEVEMVCDRVAILVQGRVALQGTLADLTRDSLRYEVEFDGPIPAWVSHFPEAQARAAVAAAPAGTPNGNRDAGLPEGTVVSTPGHDAAAIQPVIDRARAEGRTIRRCGPCGESLEDLFIRAVRDPVTGLFAAPGASREPGRGASAPARKGATT